MFLLLAINTLSGILPDELGYETDEYGFAYKAIRGNATLMRFFNVTSESIHIPNHFNERRVRINITAIEKYCCYLLNAKSISFESGLQSINTEAFANNAYLEYVDLCRTGVTSLLDKTFFNCNKLKKIDLPHGLISIGNECFKDTPIESINFPIFVEKLGEFSFSNVSVINFDFSSTSIQCIPKGAFYNCKLLTEVIIPNSCSKIGMYSFKGSTISNIIGLANIKFIDKGAFTSTKKLFQIDLSLLPIEEIEGELFNNSAIEYISFPKNVHSFGFSSFANSNIGPVLKLPQTVESISTSTFENCNSLLEIDLSLTRIQVLPYGAIKNSNQLLSIKFPSNLVEVAEQSMSNTGFRVILLPETVLQIHREAFANCKDLFTVDMKESKIEFIPRYCFSNCPNLNTIFLPKNVFAIDAQAFIQSVNIEHLYFCGLRYAQGAQFLKSTEPVKIHVPYEYEGKDFFGVPVTKDNNECGFPEHATSEETSKASLTPTPTVLIPKGDLVIAEDGVYIRKVFLMAIITAITIVIISSVMFLFFQYFQN